MEASLRAFVESQVAPIEERARATVVDIVRTCQSTVAHNFSLMIAPTSSAGDQTQPNPQTVAPVESSSHTREEPPQLPRANSEDNPLDIYREPPHLSVEAGTTLPDSVSNVTGSQNPSLDSGYSSLPSSCTCSCHNYSNTSNTANDESCSSCAILHSNFDDSLDLDFDSLFDDFDNNDNGNGS